MIDAQFLDGLSRFNLIVRKRVTSNYVGQKKSLSQGRGILFKDHRLYAPGDDFRAIDWKVFARTDDLMVKNYEEERNLLVHVIVDKSSSMHYGKPSKFDYASMLGVGFAYLAMKGNDKFQFATFSDDVEVYPSKRGMHQLIAMIDYLNGMRLTGKTDIVGMAQKYRKLIGSRSLVILISDFLVPPEQFKEALLRFGRNEVRVIQVLASQEKDPDFEGDFKMKDSESGMLLRTYFSPRAREEYLERLENHTSQLKKACHDLGYEFFQVSTDMPLFEAFYGILR